MFLHIIHHHNVSDTGTQVKPTLLGPIDRASTHLRKNGKNIYYPHG
jgi:hypothetical protein